MGPIDYGALLPQIDFTGLQRGLALRSQNRAQEREQEAKAVAKQEAEAAVRQRAGRISDLRKNPTEENYRSFMVEFPKDYEGAKAAWDLYDTGRQRMNLSDMASAYVAAKHGRLDVARGVVDKRQKILIANGEDTTETDAFGRWLDEGNLDAFKDAAFYGMAIAAGPDKFSAMVGSLGKNEREDQLQSAAVKKAAAEATTADVQADEAPVREGAITDKAVADASTARTSAEFAPAERQAGLEQTRAQIANFDSVITERSNRYALDRDKFETDVQMTLEKMDIDRTRVSDAAANKIGEFVGNAEAARGTALRTKELAGQFENIEGTGAASGLFARLDSQQVARLRREYAGIMGSAAIKSLPPGSASDTDIKLAIGGFPPPNARPSTLAKFLRGMSKLQEMDANFAQSKADWIAGNGNIGTLQRDVTVNGVRVAKGTTYGEFSKTTAARARAEQDRNLTDKPYMRYAR